MLIKLLNKCFLNYYWLYIIVSIIVFATQKDLNSLLAGLTIIYGLICFFQTYRSFRAVDALVYLFIAYSFISYAFSSYEFELYYYGIRYQVIFILFYFIGKSRNKYLDSFYERFRIPLLIVFISGLVLYFWSPSWYIQPKLSVLSKWANDYQIQEATRLSSIWPHSYFCGYSALFFLMYLFLKRIVNGTRERFFSMKICVALSVLFFAQQRVSIAFFLLFLVFLTMYAKKIKSPEFSYLMRLLGGVLVLGVLVFFFVVYRMDSAFLEYVLGRTAVSTGSDENFLIKRIHMFDSFWPYVGWLGQGLGRFGHHAITLRLPCISDNEYMRVLCELGIIGLGFLLAIIVSLLQKSFVYLKKLNFECMVVLFFLVAMIGAAPLEMATQQNFLFWFCLGRIRRFNYLDK